MDCLGSLSKKRKKYLHSVMVSSVRELYVYGVFKYSKMVVKYDSLTPVMCIFRAGDNNSTVPFVLWRVFFSLLGEIGLFPLQLELRVEYRTCFEVISGFVKCR